MSKREALWLWAVMVFGVGSKRLWAMSDNFDGIDAFVHSVREHKITSVTKAEYERADKLSIENAEEVLQKCTELGQNYLCYESEGYPSQLRRIANPPAMLFYKGNFDFLTDKCMLTVVGTRKPSQYSLDVTDRLCGELADRGFVLVSGFAEGIDQRVNAVSVAKNSFPVAVCGTPIEQDYPRGSSELKNIIAHSGVIISEYYPGCKISGGSFSARNRISVGLSVGVLFIEAARDSHGLDNFSHATYQGKPVFAVPPHDIYDKRYFGQRDLLRNGCHTVFSADDVVYILSDGRFYDLEYSSKGYNLPAEDSGFFADEKNRTKDKPVKKRVNESKTEKSADAKKKTQIDYSSLDDIQSKICRSLENRNMLADEISAEVQLDISEVFAVLTELELEGIVKSLPGKMFGL